MTRALDIMFEMAAKARNGSGETTVRLQKDIDRIDRDIRKLTDVLLKAGDVEYVANQLKAKEQERRAMVASLKRLTATPDANLTPAKCHEAAMKRINEFQTTLLKTANVTEARQVLGAVIKERLQFTPHPKKGVYEITLTTKYDELLQAMLPGLQVMACSPRATTIQEGIRG